MKKDFTNNDFTPNYGACDMILSDPQAVRVSKMRISVRIKCDHRDQKAGSK